MPLIVFCLMLVIGMIYAFGKREPEAFAFVWQRMIMFWRLNCIFVDTLISFKARTIIKTVNCFWHKKRDPVITKREARLIKRKALSMKSKNVEIIIPATWE